MKVVPFTSLFASSTSALSAPDMAREPMQDSAKRVGSSLVNIMTSRERLGLKPCVGRRMEPVAGVVFFEQFVLVLLEAHVGMVLGWLQWSGRWCGRMVQGGVCDVQRMRCKGR